LENTIRNEAASIGADFVFVTAREVTKDETISTYYGNWGWGSMWGTSISESIQRPHLYGIACRSSVVRFGVHYDKEWKVQYVYRNATADRLGIKEGDKIVITMENEEIKLKKFDEDSFKAAFGIWKDAGIKDSVKYVRKLRKEWGHRAKRLGL
jgi:hypothetical protein